MRFFTGEGDFGNTNLFDGSEVRKDNAILELFGIVDEVIACIGLAISIAEKPELKKALGEIQKNLSKIMGVIAGANETENINFDIGKSIEMLEDQISFYGRNLENPKSFTFPGKTIIGAVLDICRTIIRKMERQAVVFFQTNPENDKKIIAYFNRLSSFFYILRRYVDTEINTSS